MKLKRKLFEIKKAVRHISPDKKGYGYDYASPSKVLGIFNPLFEEHNVLLTCAIDKTDVTHVASRVGQEQELEDKGRTAGFKEKVDIIHTVDMVFTFTDLDSGEELSVKWAGVGSNGAEQGFGSALTYGERYFLLKYFGIPVDKDDPNQIRTKQSASKPKLKALTEKEAEGMRNAIKKGNVALVRTLLGKYEDGKLKSEIQKLLK